MKQQLIALSARSSEELRAAAARLSRHLDREPDQALADLAYTYQIGKQPFAHRATIVAQNREELSRQLNEATFTETVAHQPSGIAFLFTGQGSQYTGMGRGLYESSPVVRQILDRCEEILKDHLPQPLLTYLFEEAAADDLNDTRITQPALFALEYALAQHWLSVGIRPTAMIGHSLGEYVAAAVGGAMTLEEGLLLVAARGRLMHELCEKGAMVSALAPLEQVQQDLRDIEGVEISAINAADQIVVAGTLAGIEALCQKWEQTGLTHKRLPVSHAFHSHLMEPMLSAFADRLHQIAWQPLQIPLISNLTGELLEQFDATSTAAARGQSGEVPRSEHPAINYWLQHLRQPVKFADGLTNLASNPKISIFLEIGPHPVLNRLATRILTGERHTLGTLDRRKPADTAWLTALGTLWRLGCDIDWQALHTGESRRRVHVPTYPFNRKPCSVYQPGEATASSKPDQKPANRITAEHQPKRSVQAALTAYFREILGLAEVAADDSFFDLGGDSLNAIQLQARIRKELGVDLMLTDLFDLPNIDKLTTEIERRRGGEEETATIQPSIPKQPVQRTCPLSHAQTRMYLLSQKGGDTLYNLPSAMILHGELDEAHFKQALNTVIARHDQLRATFTIESDGPVQIIADSLEIDIPAADWSNLSKSEQDQRGHDRLTAEANHRFDLENGPLIRAELAKLASDEWFILFNIHHIVFDAWSMSLLMTEINEIYRALQAKQSPQLPDLPIRYTDYAVWINNRLDTGLLAESRDYWNRRLQGDLPVLDLPTDHPRPAVQTYAGATHRIDVDAAFTQKLRDFTRSHDTTLYTVLLAAWQVLLHKYSRQEDIIVGTSVAGRAEQSTENIIGMFVNTLALRADLSGNRSFADYLQTVRRSVLEDFSHQDYPFEKLVEELNPVRDDSRNPIFSVLFTLLGHGQKESPTFCNGRPEAVNPPGQLSKFDLTLIANDAAGDLVLHLEYNRDLFLSSTAERMMNDFLSLLEQVLTAADTPIRDLTGIAPHARTIHSLLTKQAHKSGDSIAILSDNKTLTFRELHEQSNRLARHLRTLGITTETPVALLSKRTQELIIAILGVLKAGGTYIPVDPTYPQARIDYLLEASQAPLVILQKELDPKLAAFSGQRLHTEAFENAISQQSGEDLEENSSPDHLAYMIFTSGSTGLPKGVQVKHQGLVNYLTWAADAYQSEGHGSFPLYSSLSFDLTVTSLFLPLLTGRTIVIQPADLEGAALVTAMARDDRFASAKFTPAHLELLVQDAELNGPGMKSLRHVIVGGEALLPGLVRSWFRHYPDTTLYNEYGPTETVVGCIVHPLTKDTPLAGYSVPIGRPIANTRIYVLDDAMKPVPVGVKGEIYIGGAGVARGYHNRPELTAERFLADPFRAGETIYKTGDLGSWQEDGTLDYHGRLDDQVKIRGFRIELGEIETVLQKHPMIREAVVTAGQDAMGQARLAAYLVTAATLTPEQVRAYLAQTLPDYMIPAHILFLPAIPLTVNGKVDRKALPAPTDSLEMPVAVAAVETAAAEPLTELQRWIADLWKDALGIEQVALDDDFFQLGGHSLKILPIIVKLKPKYPAVQIQDFFTYRTLRDLTDHLNKLSGETMTDLQAWIADLWKEALGLQTVKLDDNFFDLGGHSLKILPIIVKLKPKYPAVQIQDFFTFRTIRELSAHLESIGVPKAEPAAAPATSAPTAKEAEHTADHTAEFAPLQAALVSGATGFLGSHVVEQLITETNARVYCLVRPSGSRTADERLRDTLDYYFGPAFHARHKGRITAISGDLGSAGLGLSTADRQMLEAEIDGIIHCAADVRHYGDAASFDNTNVDGTRRLLELAKDSGDARFYFVSTISIVGYSPNDGKEVVLTEDDFDRGQILDNVYTNSKFRAEKWVREAIRDGLPGAVLRVGNLIAHSKTGQFQRNIETDAFYRILKAILLLGVFTESPGTLDMTPVDYCSRALVTLTQRPEALGNTYHLCNPNQVELTALIQSLQSFGYSITMLKPHLFEKYLFQEEISPDHREAQQLLIGHLEGGGGDTVIRIDASKTRAALEALGVTCALPDRDLMYQLVKHAIARGFFPAPKLWDLLNETEEKSDEHQHAIEAHSSR